MFPASYPRTDTLPKAIIVGCSGTVLSDDEKRFFRDFDPLGFILFTRNLDNPDQVRGLTASLRECVGREDAPILTDMEGGRIATLKPPHWPVFPPMRMFGKMFAENPKTANDACFHNAWLIAYELVKLGITVNCAPVADLHFDGAHDVIGDRAFGSDAGTVADLASSVCNGLQAGGVTPVIKHIPGHGRATVDSHAELPVVDIPRETLEQTDFDSFRQVFSRFSLPWAMSAHVKYTAIDPDRPASTSGTIVAEIIRMSMGFPGVLIADDIGMSALSGTLAERAEATLSCGNDLTMHCSGMLDEMKSMAAAVRRITPDSYARLSAADLLPAKIRRDEPARKHEADQARARLRESIRGYGA